MKKCLLAICLCGFIWSIVSCEKNSETSSSRQRCAAITKDGTRCKRLAAEGSIYCWQHER